MFFVLKFELILIIGSNNVLTEGARKVYRGRRVGQGCYRAYIDHPATAHKLREREGREKEKAKQQSFRPLLDFTFTICRQEVNRSRMRRLYTQFPPLIASRRAPTDSS
jgi:hypothetical protein